MEAEAERLVDEARHYHINSHQILLQQAPALVQLTIIIFVYNRYFNEPLINNYPLYACTTSLALLSVLLFYHLQLVLVDIASAQWLALDDQEAELTVDFSTLTPRQAVEYRQHFIARRESLRQFGFKPAHVVLLLMFVYLPWVDYPLNGPIWIPGLSNALVGAYWLYWKLVLVRKIERMGIVGGRI